MKITPLLSISLLSPFKKFLNNMDFERACIKAVFYDYPIESALAEIEEAGKLTRKDAFLHIIPQLIRWREIDFTTTESFLMEQELQEKWMKSIGVANLDSLPNISKTFILLQNVLDSMLTMDNSDRFPLVRFEQLFRWRDVSVPLGDDLLATAYLASFDAKNIRNSENLLWPDILHHDYKDLNLILSKGLSDVHAHHYATADVFMLNWISVTNSINYEKSKSIKQFQDLILLTPAGAQNNASIESILVAASYLRLKLFERFVKGIDIKLCDFKDAINLLRGCNSLFAIKTQVQQSINIYKTTALHLPNHRVVDYALQQSSFTLNHRNDANMVFYGERNLIYQYLQLYYRGDEEALQYAPYFYLYILLRSYIRKEFIQINNLKGFENFETYQSRKGIFIYNDDPLADVVDKIVIQTTLNQNDHLESRISINGLNLTNADFSKAVFSQDNIMIQPADQLSFVLHLIKPNYPEKNEKLLKKSNADGVARFADYRLAIRSQINSALKVFEVQQKSKECSFMVKRPQLVGLDAAGPELFCRPEVYGHVFRYAKKKGLNRHTYHVGEDFFDIIDGLRAIDEALLFLQLDEGCRIGHALATGIDAKSYYSKKKYRVICPRQYLLDSSVWCLMRCSEANISMSNAFEIFLNKLIYKLYLDCGYSQPFDLYSYWNSMLLRGNAPTTRSSSPFLSDWQKTAIVQTDEVLSALNDPCAVKLYQEYQYLKVVKENGDITVDEKYPEEVVQIASELQRWMIAKLSHLRISIECNPTSNLKIGYIDKYANHPLIKRFDPIESRSDYSYPAICVSVNTDDRGVFATSLYQEFSLLALALYKQKDENGNYKYNPSAILNYIDSLRENGFKTQFSV